MYLYKPKKKVLCKEFLNTVEPKLNKNCFSRTTKRGPLTVDMYDTVWKFVFIFSRRLLQCTYHRNCRNFLIRLCSFPFLSEYSDLPRQVNRLGRTNKIITILTSRFSVHDVFTFLRSHPSFSRLVNNDPLGPIRRRGRYVVEKHDILYSPQQNGRRLQTSQDGWV